MNISTGIYRLAQIVKWGGRILTILFAILCLMETKQISDFLVVVLFSAIMLAVVQGVAWVLEGFSGE